MRHVDDFIDDKTTDRYAASWFESFRRPAWDKCKEPDDRKLFATYKGVRYRVTGCSRLGDVWLHTDFNEDTTYQKRVNVDECSEWSAQEKREEPPPLHSPIVEKLTSESLLCCFCITKGGLEEGLLHGFALATEAVRTGKKIPTCFDHRVRLSFVVDLTERAAKALGGKK